MIHEKSRCRWKCRDFFIPGAPWGQPQLQSPNRCYLSCDDWQTISFSFNQSSVSALSLSLSPGITNGKWSIFEHHGVLWTFLRGAINITSFAGGLRETSCKYHVWYFRRLTARISAAIEQCSHWSLFKLGLFIPLCILKGCYTHSNPPRRNNYVIIWLKS